MEDKTCAQGDKPVAANASNPEPIPAANSTSIVEIVRQDDLERRDALIRVAIMQDSESAAGFSRINGDGLIANHAKKDDQIREAFQSVGPTQRDAQNLSPREDNPGLICVIPEDVLRSAAMGQDHAVQSGQTSAEELYLNIAQQAFSQPPMLENMEIIIVQDDSAQSANMDSLYLQQICQLAQSNLECLVIHESESSGKADVLMGDQTSRCERVLTTNQAGMEEYLARATSSLKQTQTLISKDHNVVSSGEQNPTNLILDADSGQRQSETNLVAPEGEANSAIVMGFRFLLRQSSRGSIARSTTFKCPACPFIESHYGNFQTHLLRRHPGYKATQSADGLRTMITSSSGGAAAVLLHGCEYCDATAVTAVDMQAHLDLAHQLSVGEAGQVNVVSKSQVYVAMRDAEPQRRSEHGTAPARKATSTFLAKRTIETAAIRRPLLKSEAGKSKDRTIRIGYSGVSREPRRGAYTHNCPECSYAHDRYMSVKGHLAKRHADLGYRLDRAVSAEGKAATVSLVNARGAIRFQCELCQGASESLADVRAHILAEHANDGLRRPGSSSARRESTKLTKAGSNKRSPTDIGGAQSPTSTAFLTVGQETYHSSEPVMNLSQDDIPLEFLQNPEDGSAQASQAFACEPNATSLTEGVDRKPLRPAAAFRCKLCSYEGGRQVVVDMHVRRAHGEEAVHMLKGVGAADETSEDKLVAERAVVKEISVDGMDEGTLIIEVGRGVVGPLGDDGENVKTAQVSYTCRLCPFTTLHHFNYKRHAANLHGKQGYRLVGDPAKSKAFRRNKLVNSNGTIRYKCRGCDLTSEESEVITLHVAGDACLERRSEDTVSQIGANSELDIASKNAPADVTPVEEKKYACQSCDFKSLFPQRVDKHVRKCHPQKKMTKEILKRKVFKCRDCSFKGDDKSLIRAHMQEVHGLQSRQRDSTVKLLPKPKMSPIANMLSKANLSPESKPMTEGGSKVPQHGQTSSDIKAASELVAISKSNETSSTFSQDDVVKPLNEALSKSEERILIFEQNRKTSSRAIRPPSNANADTQLDTEYIEATNEELPKETLTISIRATALGALIYQCLSCAFASRWFFTMKRHLARIHLAEYPRSSAAKKGFVSIHGAVAFKCEDCAFAAPDPRTLLRHLLKDCCREDEDEDEDAGQPAPISRQVIQDKDGCEKKAAIAAKRSEPLRTLDEDGFLELSCPSCDFSSYFETRTTSHIANCRRVKDAFSSC